MNSITTYWVWKNPNCNGINPEWEQLNGQAFYSFVNKAENKERYFVKLPKASDDDGFVVMETTKTEYVKWRKEKDHSDYLYECQTESGYITVSYHDMENAENREVNFCGEEFLRDENCDVETEALNRCKHEAVRTAVSLLSAEEQQIVEYFYLAEKRGSEREYSALTGIPRKTINDRKKRIIKKLEFFLK